MWRAASHRPFFLLPLLQTNVIYLQFIHDLRTCQIQIQTCVLFPPWLQSARGAFSLSTLYRCFPCLCVLLRVSLGVKAVIHSGSCLPFLPIHPEICQPTGRLQRGLHVSETSLTVVASSAVFIQIDNADIWKGCKFAGASRISGWWWQGQSNGMFQMETDKTTVKPENLLWDTLLLELKMLFSHSRTSYDFFSQSFGQNVLFPSRFTLFSYHALVKLVTTSNNYTFILPALLPICFFY